MLLEPAYSYCKLSKKGLFAIKPELDREADLMETTLYIQDDPVQFMYGHSSKIDREIAGFLAALMAWGRRDIVISKTTDLLQRMGGTPSEFVLQYQDSDGKRFSGFVHRTFNETDIVAIIRVIHRILKEFTDFEAFWAHCFTLADANPAELMVKFRQEFLRYGSDLPNRTLRHISNPEIGSATKRLWMYLRWCIRQSSVADPGIWTFMKPSELRMPLDVHVARQSRELGLLKRKSNDRIAVEQLTAVLRLLNPDDPVRYDYALLAIGLRKNREKGRS